MQDENKLIKDFLPEIVELYFKGVDLKQALKQVKEKLEMGAVKDDRNKR